MRNAIVAGIAALICTAPASPAAAQESAPVTRVIVGLRPDAGTARIQMAGADHIRSIFQRTSLRIRAEREINAALRVVDLETPLSGADLDDALARLAADPAVAFVEPDARVRRHAVPVDPMYAGQWYLQDEEVAAINAEGAWDVTTGSAGVVVAVLDTGVRFDHPDLLQAGRGGRLLPGRDFVGPDSGAGGFVAANDGDGWDANPADPGDWISESEAETEYFPECAVREPSSWHGTRVAGMIGAITDNGVGIAGGTWDPWILPVRVLGKCGGNNSDILQGMRWAAGLSVPDVPDNRYPAQVINMSLGAVGACTASYQSVLAELAATGVLVVASAGNEDGPVDYPANCAGVAGVAGLRHIGTKVAYSSFGPQVALAAPGGNCVNGPGEPCLFSLHTTFNLGETAPGASSYTNQSTANVGTSFSAPIVAAIAALMESVNGNLRGPQLIARLKEGTLPFPAPPAGLATCTVGVDSSDFGCACTTSTCGAGMANAPGSVAAAERPIAAIAVPGTVITGQDVVLDGTGSAAACMRTVAQFAWSVVGGMATIGGANTAVATVTAPQSGTSFTLRVTVTDDHGDEDTADVLVTSNAATTTAPASAGNNACPAAIVPADPGPFVDDGPPPPPPSGGGGGGGAWGLIDLLLLVVGMTLRQRLLRTAPQAGGRTHPLRARGRSRAG